MTEFLNTQQLAAALGTSRTSIYRYKLAGYRFKYGNRTSKEHFLKWLEAKAAEQQALDDLRLAELSSR